MKILVFVSGPDGRNQADDSGKSLQCVRVCVAVCMFFCSWRHIKHDFMTPATQNTPALPSDLRGLAMSSADDLVLMGCSVPQLLPPVNASLQPLLPHPPQAGDPEELWDIGSPSSGLTQLPVIGKLGRMSPFVCWILTWSCPCWFPIWHFWHNFYHFDLDFNSCFAL